MTDLSSALLRRIEALRTLATNPQVAMRLVGLGNDPEAELDDYVQLIRMDASLSVKMLALANSSWFSPQQPITTVKRALGMLGVNNARALAVSYCLSGLHNALRLDAETARAYWEASLCKAVAAKRLTQSNAPKQCEEAFAIALFQDLALALFAATDPDEFPALLQSTALTVAAQLKLEVGRFGMDHAQAGVLVAKRLDLPPTYQQMIGAHHQRPQDSADPGSQAIAQASYVVSFLPHDFRVWNRKEIDGLDLSLKEFYPGHWSDSITFLDAIHTEFAATVAMLSQGSWHPVPLAQLMEEACAQTAAATTQLVGQVQTLIASQSSLSKAIGDLNARHTDAERRAEIDPLTGLLNREGFTRRGQSVIECQAASRGPVAVAFFDLDSFKATNDRHGHDAGDAALQAVAARVRAALRSEDLVCRWGGDEIVVLIGGLLPDRALEISQRAIHSVSGDPVIRKDLRLRVTVTGGLYWTESLEPGTKLEDLIAQADQCLYEAKNTRRGSLVSRGRQARRVA